MEQNIDPENIQVAFTCKRLKTDAFEVRDHPERSTTRPIVHDLPPELLMEIFTWFSVRELCQTISPICKIWYLTSKHHCLWKHLSCEGQSVTTKRLCSLLSNATQLKSLQLVGRVDANAVLRQVAISNKRLQILRVKLCEGSRKMLQIQEEVVLKLITSCCKIVEITIKKTMFYSDIIFQVISVALPYLKRMHFNYNPDFGSRSLNIIASNFKPLEEVCIYCPPLLSITETKCSEREMNDNDIYKLCTNMKNSLKVLKIYSWILTNRAIQSIVQCTCLQTLSIYYVANLSDDGILLLETLRNLSSLKVQWADGVSSDGWQELFITSKWKSMRKLSLPDCFGVDDDLLEIIGRTYLNLQSICLSGCTNVTADGLSKLIKGCNQLKCISVDDTDFKVYQCFPLIPTYIRNLRCLVAYETTFVVPEAILEGARQILYDLKNKLPKLEIRTNILS